MSTPEHPAPDLSQFTTAEIPQPAAPRIPPPPVPAPGPHGVAPAAPAPRTASPFSHTWVKVAAGVGAVVLTLGAGAGIMFAVMGGGQPEAASVPAAPAPAENPELAEPDPAPAPAPAPAAPVTQAPAPPQAQPAPAPEIAPEVSGLCPRATDERYVGTTTDFSVRICRTPAGGYTYVGGNGELGYLQLSAALSGSSTGTYFFAQNGGTGYSVEPHGLVVYPEGEPSWTQEWRSGNMAEISSAG